MPKVPPRAFDQSRFLDEVKTLRDLLITNIVLIGQVPSLPVPPSTSDSDMPDQPLRAKAFSERLVEMGVDECTADAEGNPIGIIKGSDPAKPPIVLAAHLDTVFPVPEDGYCSVSSGALSGPGLLDNSLSVGVLLSIPQIISRLGLSFESDIVIAAFNESLGRANLKGARTFVREWNRPIRAAVCLEGGELGRLNYYSDAMTRLEIRCSVSDEESWDVKRGVNTILVLNEIINRIMEIRLPQRPETRVVVGSIKGGLKFGSLPLNSRLWLEIHSTADAEVDRVYHLISDIATSVGCEQRVSVELDKVSSVNASNLGYGHPLVKASRAILDDLQIEPLISSSESELSVFLSAGIPAVTVGLAYGTNYHMENASMETESLFSGLAQLFALMVRIDEGVCDGQR